jgi:hypothetical protein
MGELQTRTIVEKRLNIDGGCWVRREGRQITIDYDYAGRATREPDYFYVEDIRALAQFVEETGA